MRFHCANSSAGTGYLRPLVSLSLVVRDVVITKKMRERTKKMAILKQLHTHFKAKRQKGVGTPFPRIPAPPHPCL